MRSLSLAWTSLMLAAILPLGCAQQATFQQTRPAKVNAPLRRLAVLELKPQREEGHAALASLWRELQQSGRFELVGHEPLQAAAPSPLYQPSGAVDQDAAILAGRRLGIDGLLIAQVQFLETDGTVYGSKNIRIGDPEVQATVDYELIDVRTGQVLDRAVARSESFQGELNPHLPGPDTESEVLSRLATSSGIQAASVLLPHQSEIQVKLAHTALGPGATEIRKGMDSAKAGNWAEARQWWTQALDENPRSAAAAYNLALAHEALGEYALARRSLEIASREDSNQLYKEAAERVGRAEAEWRLAQSPRLSSPGRAADRHTTLAARQQPLPQQPLPQQPGPQQPGPQQPGPQQPLPQQPLPQQPGPQPFAPQQPAVQPGFDTATQARADSSQGTFWR